MGTTKIKAIELVFDWNIWPRQSVQKLDITNVNRMKESLRSGFSLPPIVVNRKDLRIVDGFHRTTAVLAVLGDNATIEAELRDYANDGAMLLDAGALNAYQGLTMSPKDRAHFYLKCRKMKIPPAAIAQALRVDEKKLKEFIAKRSAKTKGGEVIALSAGARNLAGLELTDAQEHYARTANGCMPEMYVSMLLNALRADGLLLNDRTIKRLQELREELDCIIERYLAEAV